MPLSADSFVDLSQKLVKGREFFKFESKVDDVTTILPDTKHRSDVWYILGEVTFCTHVGTHLEAPFHHIKEGIDVADIPINRLFGECVVVDFSEKKHQEAITLEEMKEHDKRITNGCLLFVRTGMDRLYGTPRWMEFPYLTEEVTSWLINEKKISCLGTDAAGLERLGTDYQPIHTLLFKASVPMIESLTNLDRVKEDKFLVSVFPLPIKGLDACPVRVVAIRKDSLKKLIS